MNNELLVQARPAEAVRTGVRRPPGWPRQNGFVGLAFGRATMFNSYSKPWPKNAFYLFTFAYLLLPSSLYHTRTNRYQTRFINQYGPAICTKLCIGIERYQ